MRTNFQFSNLLGTVYRQGNVLFTPDGNTVLSAVGNRVSLFDLTRSTSLTLPCQTRKDIARLALSSDGRLLIVVDLDGRALVVSMTGASRPGTVLHHLTFKEPVADIQFSPDGAYFAAAIGNKVQVWRSPSVLIRDFNPIVLHRTYTGHNDSITSITWSADSKLFLTTSKDLTAKLFTLDPLADYRPKTFSGHKSAVVAAYFSEDHQTIYTVSKDGAVFTWRAKLDALDLENEDMADADQHIAKPSTSSSVTPVSHESVAHARWGIYARNFFHMPGTKVVSVTWHAKTSMLVVGFSSGVFGLWVMPTFENVHTLSISSDKISSVAINPSGEWLAFGARKLGQLLVWEWQSESYILKQQGHFFDMNSLTYSPDAQQIATGGDDGKVKVWNTTSGFCFVTFSDHKSAVSQVEFAKQGSVLFSASLDGTVRAYDLIRYRNFRTFTSPEPVQFSSLAIDPSGEVVAAGSLDSFEIYLWSVQTGKLLDILSGHGGPVPALAFSPKGDLLLSGSWDKTVRLWDIFTRSNQVEPIELASDVLAVAFRPDGQQFAATTLHGEMMFYSVEENRQVGMIEGRKDIAGGRLAHERMSAATSANSKFFNSIAYTADGTCILAGGNSKYVILYDVNDGIMLKKYTISENLSLDGTQEFLDSRLAGDQGFDAGGDQSDLEDRLDDTLPGVSKGDLSVRRTRLEARTKNVRIAPTGRSWAAASTEGLLIYSLDETTIFDPFELSIDLTPESVMQTLEQGSYLEALIMALRLNERPILERVYDGVPAADVALLTRSLPVAHLQRLLKFIGERTKASQRVEFDLLWITGLMSAHGKVMRLQKAQFAAVLREVHRALRDWQVSIADVCDGNTFGLEYILTQQQRQQNVDRLESQKPEGNEQSLKRKLLDMTSTMEEGSDEDNDHAIDDDVDM